MALSSELKSAPVTGRRTGVRVTIRTSGTSVAVRVCVLAPGGRLVFVTVGVPETSVAVPVLVGVKKFTSVAVDVVVGEPVI
jgi:hypothetical protein